MLSSIILDQAIPSAQEALVVGRRVVVWEELRSQARRMLTTLQSLKCRRVGVSMRATAESYAALAALDRLGTDVFLFDARIPTDEILHRAGKLKIGAILTVDCEADPSGFAIHELPGEENWSGSSTVTILTSGSTGEPKAARHTWESLSRPVRKGPGATAPRWLLTYRPNLYAGLQVMLQCFSDRGTLLASGDDLDPRSLARFMSESKVQYVSATPSFWRRLLILVDSETLKKMPLVQITLGGEMVDQPLLDGLKAHFTGVRLVHIYATTELGRCFSVCDGMAGFPASYLDTPLPDGTVLRIQDGELYVRSANSMRMYDPLSGHGTLNDGWFATGDLVTANGDRVYFVGRKSDMINVAGYKVHPLEVERVIRVVPGVSDVRVFGKRSSLAGELVACEIVAAPEQDPEILKLRVNQACRSTLSNPQIPRIIKFVDHISLSTAGKTLRI